MSLLNFLNESKSKERTFDDVSSFMSGKPMLNNPSNHLPITAGEGELGWEVKDNPESLIRTYKMDHIREVIFFVNELYKYSKSLNHTIKILIHDLNVTVSTTTNDIGGISSQDKKIAKMANELYSDTRYLKNE